MKGSITQQSNLVQMSASKPEVKKAFKKCYLHSFSGEYLLTLLLVYLVHFYFEKYTIHLSGILPFACAETQPTLKRSFGPGDYSELIYTLIIITRYELFRSDPL